MRVVVLVNSSSRMGGVETVAKTLVNGFQAAGHCAQIVSLWTGADAHGLGLFPRYVTNLLPSLYRGARLGSLLALDPVSAVAHRDPVARRFAALGLRRRVPDDDDVVLLATSALTARVLALSGYRRATTLLQNHTSFHAMGDRDRAIVVNAGRRLDRVLMLTESDWDCLRVLAPHLRGGFLRNPVDPDPGESAPTKSKLVVALGRYDEPKDFALLLRAWGRIAVDVPGWRLDLYGAGRQFPLLRQLVQDLEIDDVAGVHGPTSEVRQLLAEASILALASWSEGMPLVMLEAFVAGTPVVASCCSPGVESLVLEGQAGWLVPPGDVDAFAASLREALEDHDGRIRKSESARRYVARFSTARVVEDWVSLFREIKKERDARVAEAGSSLECQPGGHQ